MLRFCAVVLVLPSIAACGGAVAAPTSETADASSDAGTTQPLSCAALSLAGSVQQVSPASNPSGMLTSAAADDHGVLVGWNEPARDPPATFAVREVGLDGAPLAPAMASLAGIGLVARGFGHAAAVTEGDFGQCTFTPVNDDGTTAGSSVKVATYGCGLFRATADGFALVVGTEDAAGPVSLELLDASGHVPSTATLLNAGLQHAAWTTLGDGSFVLVGQPPDLSNCLCPSPVYANHYSSAGKPLAAQQTVGSALLKSIALAAVGNGVLLAATPWKGALVAVQPLTADGAPQGAPATLVAGDAGVIEGPSARSIDVAPFGGQMALVAWIESTGTTTAHVVAQAVSAVGSPVSAPLDVGPAGGLHVRVVTTANGALVVWDDQVGGPVRAAPVRCGG